MGGGGPSECSGACYNRIRRPETLKSIKGTAAIQLLRRAVLRLSGKPHRSAYALPILAQSFDVEILAPLQRGKSRVGHCALDAAILAGTKENGTGIPPVP